MKYAIIAIQINSTVTRANFCTLIEVNFCTLSNILKIVIIYLIRDLCFISAETWF